MNAQKNREENDIQGRNEKKGKKLKEKREFRRDLGIVEGISV